jgi:Tol biopolymer transport system component/C-terminal processing protease CtpA/Prc
MKRPIAVALSVGFLISSFPGNVAGAEDGASKPSLAEPSLSPDHSEIAFLSGGDVWSVPSGGGTARLLADTNGAAERPLFSPDGKQLAFVSTLAGNTGIDVLDIAGGKLRRITYDDIAPTLDAWSGDGKSLYFTTTAAAVNFESVIRRVPAAGGTPVDVRAETFVNQMDAAPSPDGASLAYVRHGFGSQWWRRGHSHIDESTLTLARGGTFTSLTDGDAKVRWPLWSPDASILYYISDRSGSDELWERRDGKARQLTDLKSGRVLWPTISRDGRTIAFERDLAIWTYDVASGHTERLAIDLRGLPVMLAQTRRTLASGFTHFDLSPDGKKLAFIGRANVFAASADTGGDAIAVPEHDAVAAEEPVWASDSRRIAYVRDEGQTQAIATYAFPDGPARTITPPGHHDDYPHWSPDGTKLEFVRDGTEIHLTDVTTGADRILARGTLDRRPFGDEDNVAFSPGGEWLAYMDNPAGGFANAYVVPVSGGTPHALSALPNTNGGPLAWAPDGKRLYFVTSQRTEDGMVAQVDLIPQPPRFGEDTFRNQFQEKIKPNTPDATPVPESSPTGSPAPTIFASPKAAPKSPHVRIDFEGIEQRVALVPTGLDVASIAVTPDSKTLVLNAIAAGQQNLYAFSVDETSSDPKVAMQLTGTPGPKTRARIAPDGKSVVYLDSGRFFRAGLDTKGARPIGVSASLDIDFERDKALVFRQTWSALERWYADPKFNGVDWDAQRRAYEPYALGARTHEEFERVVNLMIGELNSSHSGYRRAPTPGAPRFSIGALGVDFDPSTYERSGALRIARIYPRGPLAVAGRVKTGDELLAVNGVAVDPHVDVASLLADTIGKRTELRFAPDGNARAAYVVLVQPVDASEDIGLRYRAWVEGRRAYVDRISGGKLGYVHLADMSSEALQKFYLDLDVQNREKTAVVIDIRNNDGGFVDPYALDVLSRHEYLHFKARFGNDAPARTSLGQRALDRATILLVNQDTLSDGEDFTEGYRVQRLGKIVGEPTAGWIIFTSAATLADGSSVRLPSYSVFAHDGVNMEQHPRGVDITVDDSAEAAARGDDPQLDAAVKSLLGGH